MNKLLFYPRLAAINLKKNSKTYLPYILTCIGTIIMYYIMFSLSRSEGLKEMSGGTDLKFVLTLGTYVVAIFAVIFLFYTNSFLMKRRKKEFGLYNILGMEKRHIFRIMLWETIFITLISFAAGILGGILLSKLMFLILLRILNFKVTMGFEICVPGILASLLLFGAIFLLILLNNIRQIHFSKPVELIRGGQTGEREPKTKWLLTLIGILTLGGGYYIALTTKRPLEAMTLFFAAVVLVIIGTYCLFTAGSIAFLKLLRNNKSYYYKTKHFASVSGMIYRMKQNAVGLANICILSTMVLVMISSTISLYAGMENILRTRYPRNIIINSSDYSDEYRQGIKDTVNRALDKNKLTAKNIIDYRCVELTAEKKGNALCAKDISDSTAATADFHVVCMIPLEDYNHMTNQSVTLKDNEALVYSRSDQIKEDTMIFMDKAFTVKKAGGEWETIDSLSSSDIVGNIYVVVKNMDILKELASKADAMMKNDKKGIRYYYYGFDLTADDKQVVNVYNEINNELKKNYSKSYAEAAAASRKSFYSIYGGLFFLGIFLGLLFMMAMILIIYYKQITEGYEDKERFLIMQQVGMSRSEVKKTIHSQVLNVFFLPLIMAAIHIAFAFPFITKILAILNLTNVTLFALCTAGAILIFTLLYAMIYALTAKEYYKIVQ